jgi:hypothetical protein
MLDCRGLCCGVFCGGGLLGFEVDGATDVSFMLGFDVLGLSTGVSIL